MFMPGDRLRQELLYRLRWKVFADINNVKVEDGLNDNGDEIQMPLFEHRFAAESIADPPVYHMYISSADVNENEINIPLFSQPLARKMDNPSHYDIFVGDLDVADADCNVINPEDDPEDYPDVSINIQNADDLPITIGQFVTVAHAFLAKYERLIRMSAPLLNRGYNNEDGNPVEIDLDPYDTTFFFEYASSYMDGEDALVDVQCFAQYALDPPVETFYARQRDNADIHRQDRLDRLRPQAPDRIKQDLLARIRWNFSKSVDDVEIEDGLDEDGTERRQPFFSDPTAAESLAEPPISSVLINSADIIKYKASVYAPDGYRYHGKLLENENAQSITIKDFVVAAHAHIYEYLGTIVDYRRDMRLDSDSGIVEQELIDEPDVLFKAAACYAVAHETAGTISTFITNEDSMTIEAFWESRRSDAVTLRELRDAYRADRAMN